MLKNISKKELAWYIGAIIIGVTGLVFIVLGIVGDNLPVDNWLNIVQSAFRWRYLGLILLAFGVIVFIITLLVNAKKVDRVNDRAMRRKQRLSAMMSDIKKDETTVVVDQTGQVQDNKINSANINQ